VLAGFVSKCWFNQFSSTKIFMVNQASQSQMALLVKNHVLLAQSSALTLKTHLLLPKHDQFY
jgi:hypothetical protein